MSSNGLVLARARARARLAMTGTRPTPGYRVLFSVRHQPGVSVARKHKLGPAAVAATLRDLVDAVDRGQDTSKLHERLRLAGLSISDD